MKSSSHLIQHDSFLCLSGMTGPKLPVLSFNSINRATWKLHQQASHSLMEPTIL